MSKSHALCLALVSIFSLGACAAAPPPNTPSGHPEVTLSGVRAGCVRAGFLNALVNSGYSIHKTSDTQIVAGKITKNFGAVLAYGTEYGGAPEERVTVLFIPQATIHVLRVVVTEAFVENPQSPFEKIESVSGTQAEEEQLLSRKAIIESKCRV